MAKDPAFLFYPGDYLRDTQNLSEKSQVAYDRIMCEHMRNICEDMNNITVAKRKVDFFTKRLNDDEKEELMFVLIKKGVHYQIEWVALSIAKRKTYSNSRSKNRMSKPQTDKKIISKTYDSHMENEIENEIKDKKKRAFFKKWLDYRKELKKPITVKATLESLVKTFNTEPTEKIKWVVEQSIQNGYQGLFWDKYLPNIGSKRTTIHKDPQYKDL